MGAPGSSMVTILHYHEIAILTHHSVISGWYNGMEFAGDCLVIIRR